MLRKEFKTAIILIVLASTLVSASTVAKVYAATEWTVSVTATRGAYTAISVLGVRNAATDGFDTAYDQIVPPEPATGAYAYFYYPSNPDSPVNLQLLSTSMIPASDNMVWEYKVKGVSTGGSMVISWNDTSVVPSQYNVYLENATNGDTLADMRSGGPYSFTAVSGTTYDLRIRVVLGSVIPEFPLGPAAVLIAGLAAYGTYRITKRPKL